MEKGIYTIVGFLIAMIVLLIKELLFPAKNWSEVKETYNEKIEKFRKDSGGKPIAYFVNLANKLIQDYRKRK